MALNPNKSAESASQLSTRAAGEVLLRTVRIRSIVDSRSAVAVARCVGWTVGLDESGMGAVAITAGELATNIARHAKEGVIRIYAGQRYLKIVAEDHGPGIVDVKAALVDGHSQGRQLGADDVRREGMGCGLGAVQRLMDRMDIQSTPGSGTCVIAIKYLKGGRA